MEMKNVIRNCFFFRYMELKLTIYKKVVFFIELVEAHFVKNRFAPPLDFFTKKAKLFHFILAYWNFFNLL